MTNRSIVWRLVAPAAIVCATAVACSGSDRLDQVRTGAATVIVHPVKDRLLSSAPDIRMVDIWPTPATQWVAALEPLQRFDGVRAVGIADGDPDLTLGTIAGAKFLLDGRLALADRDFGVIRLLGGSAPERLGGFGEGPGEFIRPIDVAEDSRGRLLVLNRTGGALRIERFTPVGFGFAFDRRLALPLYPGDGGSTLCTAAGRTYVTGVLLREEERSGGKPLEGLLGSRFLVHELGEDGDILHSFAAPYGPPRDFAGEQAQAANSVDVRAIELDVMLHFGSARVSCDGSQGGRVWIAFSELGELHLHTADGDLLWIARLRDFELATLHQSTYEFGTSVGGDPNRTFPVVRDRITDVSLITEGIVALQVTRTRTQRDRTRDFSYRTYLLDASSGLLLGAFTADHRIMSGRSGRVLLYREAPHPQAVVTILVEGT